MSICMKPFVNLSGLSSKFLLSRLSSTFKENLVPRGAIIVHIKSHNLWKKNFIFLVFVIMLLKGRVQKK